MQYKVRDGYTWLDKLNKPTSQRVVSESDPNFDGQKHKLEPINDADAERLAEPAPAPVDQDAEDTEDAAQETRGHQPAKDRMVRGARNRR